MIVFEPVSDIQSVISRSDVKRLGVCLGHVLRLRGLRQVGVRCVPTRVMQTLNHQYRGVDRATDVLSFASSKDFVSLRPISEIKKYLGDLVICPAFVRRSMRSKRMDLREEIARLLAHGTLHLFGFDHATKKQEKQMFALQERCVARVFDVQRQR